MVERLTGCAICETWRLDSPAQTLVLAAFENRLPLCIYWGAPLPAGEDLECLARSLLPARPPAVLDRLPEPSLCPEEGWAYPGQPGLAIRDGNHRPVLTQFRVASAEANQDVLNIAARDSHTGLRLSIRLTLHHDTDILDAQAELAVDGDREFFVDWLCPPALPVGSDADHMIDHAGRWCGEFQQVEVPWRRGVHMRESRRGRTGHDHFPGLLVPGETGARGFHLAWSGNHRMICEELPDGRRLVQFGALPATGDNRLNRKKSITTPVLHATFSADGLNGVSHAFHRHARRHIVRFPKPDRPRPVHYNCWEAVYFDHDLATLKDLADQAAKLGAERFVLDDGWFGGKKKGRDDDTSSLGDWFVDTRKWPQGLAPLIDHVVDLGMAFGLWVEPEMVNLDSDLARAHPEWILQPDSLEPITGRNQHVLDLTNQDVRRYLYQRIDALLSDYAIDYLKWDMNRDLALAHDGSGNAVGGDQAAAVYVLLDEIRDRHPDVEIESCSSGGARIDFGILRRTHRIWLSDSNDGHERWRMQNAAMTFLPPEIVGSHVGPRVCHNTGRILPMAFRAAVAMTGHMGFEMDLRELTPEEERELAEATDFYKANREFLHSARQYSLEADDDIALAHMSVDAARKRFLAFYGTTRFNPNESAAPLRFAGLDPDAAYEVALKNPDAIAGRATRAWESPMGKGNAVQLSGAALMYAGIGLPVLFPDTMLILEGNRI